VRKIQQVKSILNFNSEQIHSLNTEIKEIRQINNQLAKIVKINEKLLDCSIFMKKGLFAESANYLIQAE